MNKNYRGRRRTPYGPALILLVLGFLPLGVGLLFERFILSYPPDQVPPYFILGLLFLLLWGAVAFFAAGWERGCF